MPETKGLSVHDVVCQWLPEGSTEDLLLSEDYLHLNEDENDTISRNTKETA